MTRKPENSKAKAVSKAPGREDRSYSDAEVALVGQLGAILPLGESHVVDLAVRIGWKPSLFGDGPYDRSDPGGTFISIHAGIGWLRW